MRSFCGCCGKELRCLRTVAKGICSVCEKSGKRQRGYYLARQRLQKGTSSIHRKEISMFLDSIDNISYPVVNLSDSLTEVTIDTSGIDKIMKQIEDLKQELNERHPRLICKNCGSGGVTDKESLLCFKCRWEAGKIDCIDCGKRELPSKENPEFCTWCDVIKKTKARLAKGTNAENQTNS